MVQITCIKKDSGNHENRHAAISILGWRDVSTNQTGRSTRIEIYDFIKQGGRAYVADRYGDVAYLMTAITSRGTKYVKTVADETKADNLLMLPECK
jgi:hypothetical protein